jgi:hypothetical protein
MHLGTGVCALSLRISGLLYGTTVNVGEVIIMDHEQDHERQAVNVAGNPGCTAYCVAELLDQVIGSTVDYYAVFMAMIGIVMIFNAESM